MTKAQLVIELIKLNPGYSIGRLWAKRKFELNILLYKEKKRAK